MIDDHERRNDPADTASPLADDVRADGNAESARSNAEDGHVQTSDHERPVATTREGYEALGHERISTLRAIRRKCHDCSGGSFHEIALCRSTRCALFPFRMGTDPWRKKREVSPEQQEELTLRFTGGRDGHGDE